jgi:hypothetical protein
MVPPPLPVSLVGGTSCSAVSQAGGLWALVLLAAACLAESGCLAPLMAPLGVGSWGLEAAGLPALRRSLLGGECCARPSPGLVALVPGASAAGGACSKRRGMRRWRCCHPSAQSHSYEIAAPTPTCSRGDLRASKPPSSAARLPMAARDSRSVEIMGYTIALSTASRDRC